MAEEDHPDVVKKTLVLRRCLGKRKFAMDSFSAHQRSNYAARLDYEQREAQALYDSGAMATKERLLERLARKRRKVVDAKAFADMKLKTLRHKEQKDRELREKKSKDAKGEKEIVTRTRLALTNAEIRDDLREITRNIIASCKKKEDVDADFLNSCNVGDTVTVRSNLLSTEVPPYGILAAVDDASVHIRADDRDFRFPLHHFKDNRLKISKGRQLP